MLQHIGSYSDAVGSSPPTLLLFYSLFTTRQRINVRFSVPAEAVVEAQRHVSLQVFLQHLFFFPSVTFTCPRSSLHCGGYCIPMSYKSSLKISCSNVQLTRTVHSAVLRHMLLGILVQPCSQVGYEPWHQSSSGPYIFHLHRNVQDSAHLLITLWFSPELLKTFCSVTCKTFLTFSLVLHILALKRFDPRSFSYFSHPPLRNALGICSCTLELELIPLNISLPSVYDKFHYGRCSFPPRSFLSTFQYTSARFATLPGSLLH